MMTKLLLSLHYSKKALADSVLHLYNTDTNKSTAIDWKICVYTVSATAPCLHWRDLAPFGGNGRDTDHRMAARGKHEDIPIEKTEPNQNASFILPPTAGTDRQQLRLNASS